MQKKVVLQIGTMAHVIIYAQGSTPQRLYGSYFRYRAVAVCLAPLEINCHTIKTTHQFDLLNLWSFVDVPLIFSCPADHIPNWQPRILLGMVLDIKFVGRIVLWPTPAWGGLRSA